MDEKIDIVKYLLEKGANTEAIDYEGKTPLHIARNIDTAKYLVEKGADLEAKDNDD